MRTAEVICPQCKGGNPVVARNCMWCGTSLPQPNSTPTVPARTEAAPIVKSPASQSSTPPIQPTRENDANPHARIGRSSAGRAPIRVLGFYIPQLIATIAAVLLVASIGVFITKHSSQSRTAATNVVPAVAQDAANRLHRSLYQQLHRSLLQQQRQSLYQQRLWT